MKKKLLETINYVSISLGMTLTGSAYPMIGKISSAGSVPAVLLGLGLAALICMFIADAIAEMAARFPSAPGIRTYIMRAYGAPVSLGFTYISIAVLALVAGLEVDVFTRALWPHAGHVARFGIGTVLLLGIGLLNGFGVEASKSLQAVFCLAAVLLSLSISAPAMAPASAYGNLRWHGSSWQDTLAITGLSIFLFMGFEWVTPMGKNRDAYKLRVALAMPLAILGLLVLFAVFAWALLRNYPPAALAADNAPQLSLSLLYFPRWGRAITAALLVFALLTTLNAGMLAASRLLYVVARDNAFPPAVNRICVRISSSGVTYGGMLVLLGLGIVSTGLQIWGDDMILVGIVCAGLYCCLYSAYLFSFLRLRKSGPPPGQGYRTRTPAWLIAILAWLLPLLGLATIVTADGRVAPALAVYALVMLGAFGAALPARAKRVPAAGIGAIEEGK